MSFSTVFFPDPPTKDSLASARLSLSATRTSASQLSSKILAAESALAQLIRESKHAIEEMQHAYGALQDQIFRTEAYLSGIRRLPVELLREIFMWCFDSNGYEASAWTLSSVCTSWRTLALSMPLIWSKVSAVFFFWSSLEPFWDMGGVGGLDCGGDRDLVLLFAPHTPSTFLDSEQHGYAWVLSTAACHCHLRSLRPCASGEVGLFTRVIALPYKSKEAWTNAVLPIPRKKFFPPMLFMSYL